MIKKIIYNICFKKERLEEERLRQVYVDLARKAYDEKKIIENDNILNMGKMDLVNWALDDKMEIIGIEENKNNKILIVAKSQYDNHLDIYLYTKEYKSYLPRILCTLHQYKNTRYKELKIDDLLMIENSIGNGTIAMKYLLKYAKTNDVVKIKGDLSPVDKDNFIRSIPFYQKFGFNVVLNEEKTAGAIFLDLYK